MKAERRISRFPINGLDEPTMLAWWKGFGLVSGGLELQGPMLPYNLIKQNCSTVVARGLSAGGGDRYASWYAAHSTILEATKPCSTTRSRSTEGCSRRPDNSRRSVGISFALGIQIQLGSNPKRS